MAHETQNGMAVRINGLELGWIGGLEVRRNRAAGFRWENWGISADIGSSNSAIGFWHGGGAGVVPRSARLRRTVSDPFPTAPPEGIALFDLDGTLVAWDCQLLFRHFILRREPWRGVFLLVFLLAVPFAALLGAALMKRVYLAFLWRMPPEKLAGYCRQFACFLRPSIYPELRNRLENHRAAGHFMILSSASPECYVQEIGRELGFDLALGTVVEFGPLFPALRNHKGGAKVVRLRNLLPAAYFDGTKLRHAHGYTDSPADLPMLELCETVTLVNPPVTLGALARMAGWEILRPARPWTNRGGFAWRALALLLGLGRDPGGGNLKA